jgi:hypothetical protein
MRFAALFPAAVMALAQAPLKVVAVNPVAAPVSMRQAITNVEKRLDLKIDQVGGADRPNRVYVLGLTRGLYLAGYGAVFTQEVDLIESPHPNPFRQQIGPQEAASVHQRKLANLAALRKALRDMWADAAALLPNMPENEQVVVAVRMLYQSWEDTTGLPSQIMLKGPRNAAPGAVQVEEQ